MERFNYPEKSLAHTSLRHDLPPALRRTGLPLNPITVPPRFPLQWRGHWISHPNGAQTDIVVGPIQPPLPPHPFHRVEFATTVELPTPVTHAPCRVSADSRYVLTVGGAVVGRGPVRSQADRLHYDEYDLAEFLVPGPNRIELLVTYYGQPNPFWAPARSGAGFGNQAVAVFEARIGDFWLATDESWTARELGEWSAPTDLGADARLPLEAFDATAPPREAVPALVQTVKHMGGLARSQPPTMPYGRMLPRPIGALSEKNVHAKSMSSVDQLETDVLTAGAPIRRIGEIFERHQQYRTQNYTPRDVLTVKPHSPVIIEVDMGEIVAGRVNYLVDSEHSVTVRVALLEKAFGYESDSGEAHVAGSMMRSEPGKSKFEAIEVNGFRYALLLVESTEPTRFSLEQFDVDEFLYALAGDHFFTSADAQINELYRAGRRTVELNSHDAFIDCPTREQRAWAGDAYVHAITHLTCSDDWRLVRRSLELGDSPRSDGLLPMAASGDVEFIDNITIPDWSLYWIHGLSLYYRYSGDTAFVHARIPSVQRILRWFLAYKIEDRNLIGHLPEWVLTDWSAVFLDGCSSIVNGLLGRALLEFAELSEAIGNNGDARWARDEYDSLCIGFETFWDEERGVYIDHVDGKNAPDACSQMGQAAAVVSGFAPAERYSALTKALSDEDATVYRNWIGGASGYSKERRLMHLQGRQEIDWDTRTQITRAEPFGQAMVHEALGRMNAMEPLLTSVRHWSELLWEGNSTFAECWGFGTPCHGWSSSPTSALITNILGIRPAEPGYRSAVVAPRYDLLPALSGSCPTPFGAIRLKCTESTITVHSPVPVSFRRPGGDVERLAAGSHELAP